MTESMKTFSCAKKKGEKYKVIHYPRLDTVLMVEETIKKFGPCSKTELSRRVKKKIMWPTLTLILDYFENMRFTIKDKKGKIVWIYNPKIVKKYRFREDLKWKPE